MHWIEISLQTSAEAQEVHEAYLMAFGAQAITYLEGGHEAIWEPAPDEVPTWKAAQLVALFDAMDDIEAITKQLKQNLPGIPFRVNPLEDKEWTRVWMDQFEPMQFGKGLWVCPSWKTPPDPKATIIQLDPGVAFGTGTHPTTALCLTALDALPLEGKTVIDYGSGSGILAIAACLLGAKTCWAVDHDPQALISSRLNAERNDIPASQLQTCLPADLPKNFKADLVIANILAQPLISLAPTLIGHLEEQGEIILSGLLREQISEVQAAYDIPALSGSHTTLDDWACLRFISQ